VKTQTTHKPAHAHAVRPGLTRPLTAEERRRAQRVLLRLPVKLHLGGKKAPLDATTHTVSANGAMIIAPEPLTQGTKFILENPKTQKTVEVHVVRPPQFSSEGAMIPVEFLTQEPNFWNIFFPPVVN
jgi:PilZ domain-containing protein